MVNHRGRNSLGRSFSRLKSSISNSFRKSNYFPKYSLNSDEILNNESYEASTSFRDHKLPFAQPSNNVNTPFQESAFSYFENSSGNNNVDFDTLKSSRRGTHLGHLEYSNDQPYSARYTDRYPPSSSDHQLWSQYVKYLNKEEFDRIYREYVDRNGREFLNVGLKTYIDAVIETKRFRNKCFHVLSKNSTSSQSPNYFNHQDSSSSQAHAANRTYLTPEASYDRSYVNNYSSYPNDGHNYPYNSNSYSSNNTNYSDPNNFNSSEHGAANLLSSNLSPEKHDFSNINKARPLTDDRDFPTNKSHTVDKIDNFISNYDYLNSANRYKNLTEPDTPSSSKPGSSGHDLGLISSSQPPHNGTNLTITAASALYDNLTTGNNELNKEVLTHNEKLRLLEKIGIDDDYIAKRVCSKFSNRVGTSCFVRNNKKKSLEDFNLFHKENLKHQLDLNQQLSQELIHISNLNTPNALDTRLKNSSCNVTSTDLFKSALSDNFLEGSSLFRRISNTIDKNKDSSPVNLLSLTYS